MAKLDQAYIDQTAPIKSKQVYDEKTRKYKTVDATNYTLRNTLISQMQKDAQNLPERVGAGGDALNALYEMIPIRLRPTNGFGGFQDENAALRNSTKESIFNLEQVAKAEKLKSRKRDKQAFGGGASTPEKRVPVGATQGDVGTLLGSSNTTNKTLLGG